MPIAMAMDLVTVYIIVYMTFFRVYCGNKSRVLCPDMWAMLGAALRQDENETTWYMQKQEPH